MGTVFDFGMNGYYFSDEVLTMFEETLSPRDQLHHDPSA